MKLSVCLIVKNEEQNIPRCLNSIKGEVDEIVVVDTGSTDRTKEIASNFNCKIIDFKWCNDFSKARNVSIDNATNEWILFLDADEEIPREDLLRLKNRMRKEENAEAYFFKLINFIKGKDIGSAVVLRAFKNRPEYRFKGALHEQIIDSIENAKKGIVIPTEIRIFHYGYDEEAVDISIKSKRNLEILLSYDENKKDGYYYYALGNEYGRINQYEDAIEMYEKSLAITNYKKSKHIYFPYLVLNTIKAYSAIKRFSEGIRILEYYKKDLSDFKDMYFLGMICSIECGRYSKAKEYLNLYFINKDSSYEYPNNRYDKVYNISQILKQLDGGIVNKSKLLIGCAFIVDKVDVYLLDSIKNIGELAEEIIVFNISNKENDIEIFKECLNIGAKIIKCTEEEIEENILKKFSTKWILILNNSEVIPYNQQEFLANILEDEKCIFKVDILDRINNNVRIEERIIYKNLLEAKIQKNIEKYVVKEIDITIYENFFRRDV